MLSAGIFIKKNTSIKDALKTLNKTAEKALLVVDDSVKLLGTLTDGDIRRYILSGKNITESADIGGVYNKKPIYISKRMFSIEAARETLIKNKIELLPILDEEGKVADYTTWTKVFSGGKIARKKIEPMPVVIMAGGKGTRLDPFTRILPKSLIPVGEKAIIEVIMDKFYEYGISEFYISINHKAKMVKAYFEEINKKYVIHYLEEEYPLGTAGSLRFLRGKVKDSLMVSNCDIIVDCDYSEIVEFHKSNNYDITIIGSLKHFVIPYGVCVIEKNGLLTDMIEKPEHNFLVNTGMCILRKQTLDLIPHKQKFHITDLVKKARRSGGKVGVFPISESSWIDVGQWEEYKKSIHKLQL